MIVLRPGFLGKKIAIFRCIRAQPVLTIR